MADGSEYTRILDQTLRKAQKLAHDDGELSAYAALPALGHRLKAERDGEQMEVGKSASEGIQTIVGNLDQNKYLFSILATCLVEKLVNPEQDIRLHQADMPGGYSNRSKDQVHITPFLKQHGLTYCAASGMESGRNFERPFPLTLDFGGKPRGEGNREAFLGILHAIEAEGVNPRPCLDLLLALDIKSLEIPDYDYPKPEGLTVQEITAAIVRHHDLAKGQGKSRLPVLAVQAVYQCLVTELARYTAVDAELRDPPNRHTANDKKGFIGDVQVDLPDGTPFEGVEVKSGKKIDRAMVGDLPGKFKGIPVNRYYVLSTETEYIAEDEREDIENTVDRVRQETGGQIIVNGLYPSLRYYLRLISDTGQFLTNYTQQVETDEDVKAPHKAIWLRILTELSSSQTRSTE